MMPALVLNHLSLWVTLTSGGRMLVTGTCKNPQVLQFLRNAVWHYGGLDSGATKPVKDISAKQKDSGVAYSLW